MFSKKNLRGVPSPPPDNRVLPNVPMPIIGRPFMGGFGKLRMLSGVKRPVKYM
jgi:hypothetical protein